MTRQDAEQMLRESIGPDDLGEQVGNVLHEERLVSDTVRDNSNWTAVGEQLIEWLAGRLTDEYPEYMEPTLDVAD